MLPAKPALTRSPAATDRSRPGTGISLARTVALSLAVMLATLLSALLSACGGASDQEPPQSLAAQDDSDNNTEGDNDNSEGDSDTGEATESNDTPSEDAAVSETGAETTSASVVDDSVVNDSVVDDPVVDDTIPENLTVVTAPPLEATTTTAVSTDGVVFERIDASPELPGMTTRPIIKTFIDPENDRLVRVHFGALFCDGFRIVVDETDTTVSVTLEGATTLSPDQDPCSPEMFATEMATLLSAPLDGRELLAVEP